MTELGPQLVEVISSALLLLEDLRPWDQLPPAAKRRCVELTLAIAQLPDAAAVLKVDGA